MATDSFKEPLKELETLISEGLGRFWRSDPTPPSVSYDATEGLPETPAAEQVSDSPRHGITTPAPANALREEVADEIAELLRACLLYTSPSPRDVEESRMPSSA